MVDYCLWCFYSWFVYKCLIFGGCIFVEIMFFGLFASTALFLFPASIRFSRSMQRVIFILSTFIFDYLLMVESMRNAGSFVAPLILFIGFHSFLLSEVSVRWIAFDWKFFLSPKLMIFIVFFSGLLGVVLFGFSPRFVSFLCGVLLLGIPVSLFCFWGAGMNTMILLRSVSVFFYCSV